VKADDFVISGPKLISLDLFQDARGFFVERYNERKFAALGLPTNFVQDNHSRSAPGVIRGLHFQFEPPTAKLVGVVRGRIWDVFVDLREESPTFGRHGTVELTGDSGQLLMLPADFAHGFCVLGDEPADVFYKVDTHYNAKGESGFRWDDPDLAIPWPIQNPIVSEKDRILPTFREFRKSFP